MRTPTQALIWELWRLSRWELLFRTLAQSLFWCGVFYLLGAGYAGDVEPHDLAGFVLMLMVGTSMSSGMWMKDFDNKQNGFPFRLGFTRPIGTPLLVAAPMFYLACSAALCYLIPATVLRMLFDIPFPLFPIAVVIVVAYAGFTMAAWSPRRFLSRMACVAVCCGAVVIIGANRLPESIEALFGSTDAIATTFSLSTGHYAALLLLFIGSVAATIFAVDRQRHGEQLSVKSPRLELACFAAWFPRRNRPFATPGQAQFWFEMRRSGTRLLLVSLGTALFAFFGILFLNTIGHYRGKAAILWCPILCASPAVFMLIGAEWLLGLKRQQGAVWLSSFDATQSMDNSGLAFIKLAVLTACVCLSWMVLAVTAVGWMALWGDLNQWFEAGRSIGTALAEIPAWLWVCVALVLVVNFITTGAMLITIALMLPLRPKTLITALLVMAGYSYVALWDSNHGWLLRRFWEVHAWLLATALVAATFLVWKKAIGEGHLARRHFIPALSLWAVHVGAVFALWLWGMSGYVSVPLSVTILGLGTLALPLASIAVCPLALSAHRHR